MWFSEIGNRVGSGIKRSLTNNDTNNNNNVFRQEKLNILAFETAKTMSRLVSLQKSLSDNELLKLRKCIIKSEGVSYLTSKDEEVLLKLACTEKMEDLDLAAIAVARLGKRCSDPSLNDFETMYEDLKLGFVDLGNFFVMKKIERTMDKMEKFISATSDLYSGLETLAEMELSERKVKQWKYNGTVTIQKANFDLFDQKMSWQKQHVRHLRQVSLWGQTFNKAVRLMVRTICIVYARMCVVFSRYISVLPPAAARHVRFHSDPIIQLHKDSCSVDLNKAKVKGENCSSSPKNCSGSPKNSPKLRKPTFWSGELEPENHSCPFALGKMNVLIKQATPSTIGGSGLGLRYANVVILTEKYLKSSCNADATTRDDIYRMLTITLRKLVKSKLKRHLGSNEPGSVHADSSDGLKNIMSWLGPMARDTIKWQAERNVEKKNFDARPKVLLLQTLFFADREKTEATIAEVLVGLSCVRRHDISRVKV
ncbi:hypothetical protein GIB67_026613 [Kingdonia uniflora]|uniref:Uncharacterized protein n=1 Tax=Kingdonia uniflora TaxID=39325 RepID=A0A7J7P9G0_9MAGN|nr:hypothetical protein GIB67_026613 [Kingdonia uniflora]